MLIRSWKNKEGLSSNGDLIFVLFSVVQIINFTFSKEEYFSFCNFFLEVDPPGHILDVLHNEINRHPIISEARDDDIRIDNGGQDEVPEGILDKLVVLLKHADH